MKQLLGFCIASLLTACANTPPTNFYILEALSQSSANLADAKMLVGVGPLTMPALLDRRQIVTRKENNAIQLAEFHQWAAPLRDNILAVLSKNIAAQQPNAIVRAYPWGAYGEIDYRVIIDINRLDSQLGKSAILEASWAIMAEKNHSIIRNGQIKLEQPSNDVNYESVVSAFNKLLNDFSQKLSLALRQLPQK